MIVYITVYLSVLFQPTAYLLVGLSVYTYIHI